MGINGYDLDATRWKNRYTVSLFFGGGGIEDPTDFDATDAKNMEVFELCVSFVVVGWYEWYDKINLNVLQSNFHQG